MDIFEFGAKEAVNMSGYTVFDTPWDAGVYLANC